MDSDSLFIIPSDYTPVVPNNSRDRSIIIGVVGSIIVHAGFLTLLIVLGFTKAKIFSVLVTPSSSDAVFMVSVLTPEEFAAQAVPKNIPPPPPVVHDPDPEQTQSPPTTIGRMEVPAKIPMQTARKTAPVKTQKTEADEKSGPITASTIHNEANSQPSNQSQQTFEQAVALKLAQSKRYPPRARSRGVEGKVIIELTLRRDGSVVKSDIISSESPLLDEGVDAMIARAAPFPPFPETMNQPEVSIQIPVRFSLS